MMVIIGKLSLFNSTFKPKIGWCICKRTTMDPKSFFWKGPLDRNSHMVEIVAQAHGLKSGKFTLQILLKFH